MSFIWIKYLPKPVFFGITGSLFLLLFYFTTLTFLNSFEHALYQFYSMWIWVSLLSIGFGIQIGLFTHTHTFSKKLLKNNPANASIVVSEPHQPFQWLLVVHTM